MREKLRFKLNFKGGYSLESPYQFDALMVYGAMLMLFANFKIFNNN